MLFFGLSARTSQKTFKNDLGEPSRAPSWEGKSIRSGLKTRQEGPKTLPRALHVIFQLPFSRLERS